MVCLLTIPLYIYVQKSWPVRVVKLKGSYRHISEAELQKHITPVIPQSMLSFSSDSFNEAIKHLPWIKSASVRRLWPDTLLIYFQEYKPFARWCTHGILTTDGTLIKTHTDDDSYQILETELCGPEGTEQIVLNQYNRFKLDLSQIGLTLVRVNLSGRYAWELTLSNGLLLKLGRENVWERLQNMVSHWQSLKVAIPTAAIVDLRYPNGIAVRGK